MQRRDGRRLQVVAEPGRAAALARIPGVAGARQATTAFGDAVAASQGVERSGADVLGRVADGGAGVTIAMLDLGFGSDVPRLQALGELPPPARLETLTFDAADGLAGRNAYGNRTNHGEIVAQTVYDYAPDAHYLFVNYHTEADFLAATDALIARHPDIVVHSNSFIEGPFDGTGPAGAGGGPGRGGRHPLVQLGRQLRPAALERHLGRRRRRRRPRLAQRRQLDLRARGRPADHVRALVDLAAGRPAHRPRPRRSSARTPTAPGRPATGSTDRQSQGLPPAERITGYSPARRRRLPPARRARLGPAARGRRSRSSRARSRCRDRRHRRRAASPRPGDATGAITVGAVDWRGNASSRTRRRGRPTTAG